LLEVFFSLFLVYLSLLSDPIYNHYKSSSELLVTLIDEGRDTYLKLLLLMIPRMGRLTLLAKVK